MEDNSAKLQTHIEIKPQEHPISFEYPEFLQERKFPFFKSRSRRRKSDTWLISIFVIFHILAFIATMIVNDCWRNSHGDCAFEMLGRVSFQPITENPLLGPSASTLDKMGALRRTFLVDYHQIWRLFTCQLLHAGAIHLIINLSCILIVGMHLERDFGPLRIGIIYVLSAFVGSLVSALFVRNSPVVTSSACLFGLLGATFSALTQNWKVYTKKCEALAFLSIVSMTNLLLGLLPYIDNFSNLGAFVSGFFLGFLLLFTPQLRQVAENNAGLFEINVKSFTKLRQKLDRPIMRSVSLLLFGLLLAGCLVAVLQGIDLNQYCGWCRFVDCIPSKRWSCNEITATCETMESNSQLTLTCMSNGNFRVFPFTNVSLARIKDLCTLIC